jgi:hypothetical protein
MVVETQAIAHPRKTKRTLCVVEGFPRAARTAKVTPHTRKQPMEYAQ